MSYNAIFSAVVLFFSIGTAQADGHLKKGKKLYKKCIACHNLDKEKNKIGPYLKDVFGRKAGDLEKYKYSKAMKKKGKEGLIWTDDTLDKYLEKPKKFVPGTKMIFPGLKKAEQRKMLIVYIKTFSDIKEEVTDNKLNEENKDKIEADKQLETREETPRGSSKY